MISWCLQTSKSCVDSLRHIVCHDGNYPFHSPLISWQIQAATRLALNVLCFKCRWWVRRCKEWSLRFPWSISVSWFNEDSLVGGLVAIWIIFPEILGMSSSQLTNSYFSEGWPNHQPGYVGLPAWKAGMPAWSAWSTCIPSELKTKTTQLLGGAVEVAPPRHQGQQVVILQEWASRSGLEQGPLWTTYALLRISEETCG